MSDTEAIQPASPEALAQARESARELVRAKERMLTYYREKEQLSLPEAEQKTDGTGVSPWHERTKNANAREVTWYDLNTLAEADPDAAMSVWQRVRAEAADDLATGDMAARSLEERSSPWERAQFFALRESFRQEWRPCGGIESALIDTLAQAQTGYLFWLRQLQMRATREAKDVDGTDKNFDKWLSPRVSVAEAIEQAATMADRFNRLFLRTLRALRDLRRYSPSVVVQNAGQVNIGEKQINVAGSV